MTPISSQTLRMRRASRRTLGPPSPPPPRGRRGISGADGVLTILFNYSQRGRGGAFRNVLQIFARRLTIYMFVLSVFNYRTCDAFIP